MYFNFLIYTNYQTDSIIKFLMFHSFTHPYPLKTAIGLSKAHYDGFFFPEINHILPENAF